MNQWGMLQSVFDSRTIKPSFKLPHVIFTIMRIGNSPQGIGRYKIKDELNLGEGSVKTLLNRLAKMQLITPESKHQMGHVLTESGQQLLDTINRVISFPQIIENAGNKYVLGLEAYYIPLKRKDVNPIIRLGIDQRDEAIKIGGTGASVLTFNGEVLVFANDPDQRPIAVPFPLKEMQKSDLVIIGGGNTKNQAILSTIAAALSLINMN